MPANSYLAKPLFCSTHALNHQAIFGKTKKQKNIRYFRDVPSKKKLETGLRGAREGGKVGGELSSETPIRQY